MGDRSEVLTRPRLEATPDATPPPRPGEVQGSLTVLWLSHSARLGGAELALAEGVTALARLGHAVHVVLPEEGPLRERLADAASIAVVHSNRWVSRERPSLIARVRQLAFNLRVAAPRLASLAAEWKADVLLTSTLNMPSGAFAARRASLPHVWYIHEYGDADHGHAFHWRRRPTLAALSILSARVLVNSEALQRHYARSIPVAKIRIVPYAVEIPETLAPSAPEDARFRLVLVGAKSPGKGQADAVRAVAQLAARGLDIALDLVGGGDPAYETELRRLVADLGIEDRVRFVPFETEPLKWVARADVALMCSRAEAFGRVTVEAMKLGKPVIGARSGATPEHVRDGENGLLYTCGRPDELAQGVERLYRDRALARTMGERARRWAVERFTIERFGRGLEQALREASEARRR